MYFSTFPRTEKSGLPKADHFSFDRCIGEILLHEVHFAHLEGAPIQVRQRASFGGKGEGQFVGIQCLVVAVEAL